MSNLIGTTYVPDEGPEDAKIVLVGEAPGEDEEYERRPFVGAAGEKLITVLGRNGVMREEIRLANLSHYRPAYNKFEILLGTKQLRDGTNELYESLRKIRPTVIGAMGNWPLYFLTGKKGKKPGSGIDRWRGSILPCTVEGLEGTKVIATNHPAAVVRDYGRYPIFDADIKRIVEDSAFPELRYPERKLVLDPKEDLLEHWTLELLKSDRLSVDVETIGTQLTCVGFAPSPSLGVVIGWNNTFRVRDCVQRLLRSGIPLVFHFGTFDTEVLEVFNQFEVKNFWWDTLVAQHVMWPELPRSLAYLTSVLTRQPYYKEMRKEADEDQKSWSAKTPRQLLYEYNGLDICCTAEVQLAQEREIDESVFKKQWRKFFSFEMDEVRGPAKAIMRAGNQVDEERRKLLEKIVLYKWADFQNGLNRLVGTEINTNSHPQVTTLLYEVLKLPAKYKREPAKDGKKRLTADEDAMISLISYTKNRMESVKRESTVKEWKRKFLILKGILLIRGLRKLSSAYIDVAISDDGRIRSTVKVGGGPKTGRWSMEKYVDKTGVNLQTVPRDPIDVPEEVLEAIVKGEV